MITVVVVDDQPVVREGFAALLDRQDDICVAGTAGDGEHALALCGRERPDVVLMDVRMPVLDGVAATGRLVADHPDTRVLMLTTFDIDEYVYAALRAGASGFLLKDATAADLVAAVRAVASGGALLAPTVTRRLVERFVAQDPLPPDSTAISRLTPREREVLTLVARGLSNAEVARALHLAEETIKTHVGRVLGKLGLRDRVQAVVFAYENGVVTPRAGGYGRPRAPTRHGEPQSPG
ncbi:response regulator transcription factor [Actinokineospora auranticolor]|uniref:DNA-binding NarL/FixJ family response regulator n=1 Tax=Actinokineospora auranticolor TaxID=155976 RepID=A0A2S6H1R1_9PSEU|nr:response regulator transcription factor [Actinokineospora auranticolor]PPK71371.1 DNA-binding NarL/FixJ family response regulator [Actinokineospora auranticolor]